MPEILAGHQGAADWLRPVNLDPFVSPTLHPHSIPQNALVLNHTCGKLVYHSLK
jgi:hypothetical protein